MAVVEYRSRVEASAEDLYAWHARAGAFDRLKPPWQDVRVVERGGESQAGRVEEGSTLVMSMPQRPVRRRWLARHFDFQPGRGFKDEQVKGPFARWVHTHRTLPADPPAGGHGRAPASTLVDHIEYALPLGALGRVLGGGFVRRKLDPAFYFRHRRTQNDLARHAKYKERGPLRVAITGATGMVGSALKAFLATGGHRVETLVRRAADRGAGEIAWQPAGGAGGSIDAAALEGVDAVVHLAGENIGSGRWSARRKESFVKSRVGPTDLLCGTLAGLRRKPGVLVSASATGYYGDRGQETITESSPKGAGFLPDLCAGWEGATRAAQEAGIRVVNLRIGVVLSAEGGALKRMLTPYRLGGGGVLGTGRQWLGWIAPDDLTGVIHEALFNDALAGPVNAVSPEPVTNRQLTKTLGRVLHRPTLMKMPAAAVKLVFGEMGRALLLEGAKVLPTKLQAAGFEFLYPTLEAALRNELGRMPLPERWGEEKEEMHNAE